MTRPTRWLAVMIVLALVVAACGPTSGDEGSQGSPTIGLPSSSHAPPAPTTTRPPDAGPSGPASTDRPPGGGTEPDAGPSDGAPDPGPAGTGPPPAAIDDLGPVGANGRAYLRPDRPRLVVEIDVQEGARPTDAAIEHLRTTIERYADKPDGVGFAGGNGFVSSRTEWTRGDLRAVAQENRSHYSDDDTTVLYLLYVRGGFHHDGEETQAVGVTYNASEIALFPDRWSGIGSLVGADRDIERAVLVHEFGHALGLVNLTYESEIAHEDPEHPGHSSSRRSVMYWAVETTLIGQVFDGPPPDEFDDADRADIEGLRTGRY